MGLNSAFKGLSINVNWCFKVYICAYVGIKPVIITKCTVQHQKLNYCVLKRFINNSNLKYFLKRKALCCLTQSRGANSQNIITMGKIRMCSSPLQLLSNVFSLIIRHSRPLNSLTPSVNDNDYFTLTILSKRYKRNHLPTYLPFSRNTIAYIGRNTKMCYRSRRETCKLIWNH